MERDTKGITIVSITIQQGNLKTIACKEQQEKDDPLDADPNLPKLLRTPVAISLVLTIFIFQKYAEIKTVSSSQMNVEASEHNFGSIIFFHN